MTDTPTLELSAPTLADKESRVGGVEQNIIGMSREHNGRPDTGDNTGNNKVRQGQHMRASET